MNEITTIPAWASETIGTITRGFQAIHANALAVSQAYVEAKRKDPRFVAWFNEATGNRINRKIIRWMERIGSGEMDPRFLLNQVPDQHVLRLEKYGADEQKRALDEPLPVLTADGSELLVKLENLTPEQVAQVFARDHIRDIPAQKAWIESEKMRKQQANNGPTQAATVQQHVRLPHGVVIDRELKRVIFEVPPNALSLKELTTMVQRLTV
jgi:hypothetical protein